MSTIFTANTCWSIRVAEEANGEWKCQDRSAGEDRWKPLSFLFPSYLEVIAEKGIREDFPEVSARLKAAAKKILDESKSV